MVVLRVSTSARDDSRGARVMPDGCTRVLSAGGPLNGTRVRDWIARMVAHLFSQNYVLPRR